MESFGTLNWSVCDPMKRATRSTKSESISFSRASGSADNSTSFNDRPTAAGCSVWINVTPSVIVTSPFV